MPEESITLMEQPHRARDTIRSLSVDRFYEIRGMGAGVTAGEVISRAEGLLFPKIGDTADHLGTVVFGGEPGNLQPQPCFDRGLVTLLGPHAEDGTQGAILFARFGFIGGGGGGVVGNQASGTSVSDFDFNIPMFLYNATHKQWERQNIPSIRTRSVTVFSGILTSNFTVDEVRSQIAAFQGGVKILPLDLPAGPLNVPFLFTGARLIDRPGEVVRYAASFSTTSLVKGIPQDRYGVDDTSPAIPPLWYLSEYVVQSGLGLFVYPFIEESPWDHRYELIPDEALTWIRI